MLPPGSPPSWSSTGGMSRNAYGGPPTASIVSTSVCQVTDASVVASLTGPLLSWISSIAITSGDWRWSTIRSASSAHFGGASLGSRFSTLNVATVM